MGQPPQSANTLRPAVATGSAQELRGAEDIFFAAIEMTRMPMLVTDPRQPDNPIVFANRAFIAMSQYTTDEIIGRNCRFLQGPDTDPEAVARIRDAIGRRSEISIELLNYRKDGSSFWNALFLSPVFNKQGELVYFFASQLDVSRRRDAEDALAQARKMEALGQLTGGISHDFNNLLQVMAGHVDLLRLRAARGVLTAADAEQGLARVRDAIDRSAALTQQLLAFSRKQTLKGRVINLNGTLASMEEMIATTLGETIAIEYDMDPALPNCELDTTQLQMALLNLVVNARDAIDNGGSVRITTRAAQLTPDARPSPELAPGDYVCIEVADTGRGIPPELIERVMEPFFTTKDVGRGTGLGLASVYGFARQSGGMATIESGPGRGTTVRLYFPAVDAQAGRATETGSAHVRGGDEIILVVDDREDVAELAAEMLRSVGYTVKTAQSGAEALAVLASMQDREMPHLLFTDVVMPGGMDGYQLAQEARRRAPHLQVLLASGYERDLGRLADVAPAEFEVLRKPYEFAQLVGRVRQVLDESIGPRM